MASALFEEQRDATTAVAVWTVHIFFPAFQDLPAKNFYWATSDQIELEDGNVYTRQLTDPPRGRAQRDRGNDYAEIVVSNPDNALYQDIRPYENLIEKAEVTIRECYQIEPGLYESEVRFFGSLKDFTHNHADNVLNITAMSDMSRSNYWVANRVLTRERCGTEFNFNGLGDPTVHICGWQTAQGGNPDFCTKFLDGPDGCKAHNNSHRFFAVTALATAPITIMPPASGGGVGGGGGGDDTGWGTQTDPCFTKNVYMLMNLEMDTLPMDQVRAGMSHVGFDPFNSDKLVDSEIIHKQINPTQSYWNAAFDQALLESAHHHLFYIGNARFMPVALLGENPAIGISPSKKPATSHLLSINQVMKDTLFYEFHTKSKNYIITDKNKRFFYFVHNLKFFSLIQV